MCERRGPKGSGGRKSPSGVQSPGRGLGDEVPQKLTLFCYWMPTIIKNYGRLKGRGGRRKPPPLKYATDYSTQTPTLALSWLENTKNRTSFRRWNSNTGLVSVFGILRFHGYILLPRSHVTTIKTKTCSARGVDFWVIRLKYLISFSLHATDVKL